MKIKDINYRKMPTPDKSCAIFAAALSVMPPTKSKIFMYARYRLSVSWMRSNWIY